MAIAPCGAPGHVLGVMTKPTTATVRFEYEATVVEIGRRKAVRRRFSDVTAVSFRHAGPLVPAVELALPSKAPRAWREMPALDPSVTVGGFEGRLWTPIKDQYGNPMDRQAFLAAVAAGATGVFGVGFGNPFVLPGTKHDIGALTLPLPDVPIEGPAPDINEVALKQVVEVGERDRRAADMQRIADSVIFSEDVAYCRRHDPVWVILPDAVVALEFEGSGHPLDDSFRADRLDEAKDWVVKRHVAKWKEQPSRQTQVHGAFRVLEPGFLSRDDLASYTANLAGMIDDLYPQLIRAPASTIAEWVRLRDGAAALSAKWTRVGAEDLVRGLDGLVPLLRQYANRADRRTAVAVAAAGRKIAALCERASRYDGVTVSAAEAAEEDAAIAALES